MGTGMGLGRMTVLRAEWTKMRTVATTAWLLVAALTVTVGVAVAVVASIHVGGGDPGAQDPARLSLGGVYLGQVVVAVIGVLILADEYETGLIRLTLAATPGRLRVLGAKLAMLEAVVLPTGLLAVAGSLLAGRLALPGAGLDPAHGYAVISLAHAATVRAGLGTVAYLGLVAALALGVTAVVRDTAASIGTILGLLFLPPLLAAAVSDPLRRHLEQLSPMTAGLAIQATTNLRALPLSPWAGLGVLTAWAAGALALGAASLRWRDA
jgi:ABC-2 type transport system permease protein